MPADAPTDSTTPTTSEAPAMTAASRVLLARAQRVWRRAGVRREDRAALADELVGELEAADADGYPSESVLGADPEVTMHGWALERGMAGRSLQAQTMLAVVTGGVLLGASTAIVALGVTSWGDPFGGSNLTPQLVTLVILVSSVVMCVLLPVLGTWAALHHRGDPRAGATARWLAVFLPPAGMVGVLLLVLLGAVLQDHEVIAWPAMTAALLGTCAGSGLLARRIATRYAPIPR